MNKRNDYDKYDFLKHYIATITIFKDKEKKIPNNEVGPITINVHIGSGVEEREEERLNEVLSVVLDRTPNLLEKKGVAQSAFDVMIEKVENKAA